MLQYSFMRNKTFLRVPELMKLVRVRYNQSATAVSVESNTVVLDKTMLQHSFVKKDFSKNAQVSAKA